MKISISLDVYSVLIDQYLHNELSLNGNLSTCLKPGISLINTPDDDNVRADNQRLFMVSL